MKYLRLISLRFCSRRRFHRGIAWNLHFQKKKNFRTSILMFSNGWHNIWALISYQKRRFQIFYGRKESYDVADHIISRSRQNLVEILNINDMPFFVSERLFFALNSKFSYCSTYPIVQSASKFLWRRKRLVSHYQFDRLDGSNDWHLVNAMKWWPLNSIIQRLRGKKLFFHSSNTSLNNIAFCRLSGLKNRIAAVMRELMDVC